MKMQTIKNTIATQRLSGLILSVALLLLMSTPSYAGVAVIMGPDSSDSGLAKDDVRGVFLAKRSNLPSGQQAHPADQNTDASAYKTFIEAVLGKTESQLKNYWSRLVFSGKGTPPDSLASDQAVKDYVRSTVGGIGYIDSAAVDGSVKVVYSVP